MKKIMKKLKQKNDIGYICSTFGNQYLLTVAMEECAELIQAVSKIKRYGCSKEYCDNLSEEIADVSICIEALLKMNCADTNKVNDYYKKKLKRLFNRAKELKDSKRDGWINGTCR